MRRCLLCDRTMTSPLDWWTLPEMETIPAAPLSLWLGICLICQDAGVDVRRALGSAWDKLVVCTPTSTGRPSSTSGGAS